MKKIITIALAAIMMLTSTVLFSACGNKASDSNESSDKVKYINIKLTDEQYAYAINPNDKDLLKSANDLLKEIKANGEFDKIVAKYFKSEGKPTGYEAGTVNSAKDQLVVATNTPFSPFEYKEGNLFYGVDIEVAAMLAKKLNKELVIVDMEFDAILTSVNTGKADIGMAGLTISEERKTLASFTDPYYEASQVVVAKANDTRFDSCKTASDVEDVLKGLDKNTIVGVQTGTTGQLYVEGDEDFGFDGYKVECKGYESASSAVTDMLNGSIALVVVDEAPAISIVSAVNG